MVAVFSHACGEELKKGLGTVPVKMQTTNSLLVIGDWYAQPSARTLPLAQVW